MTRDFEAFMRNNLLSPTFEDAMTVLDKYRAVGAMPVFDLIGASCKEIRQPEVEELALRPSPRLPAMFEFSSHQQAEEFVHRITFGWSETAA